jgi:hypothetical protein
MTKYFHPVIRIYRCTAKLGIDFSPL